MVKKLHVEVYLDCVEAPPDIYEEFRMVKQARDAGFRELPSQNYDELTYEFESHMFKLVIDRLNGRLSNYNQINFIPLPPYKMKIDMYGKEGFDLGWYILQLLKMLDRQEIYTIRAQDIDDTTELLPFDVLYGPPPR